MPVDIRPLMPMSLDRRRFLRHSGFAAAGLSVAGSGWLAMRAGGAESAELRELRRRVASYAGRQTVRSDDPGELHLVCEIADLGRFAEEGCRVAPEGVAVRAEGNLLSFEHNGRRVSVENVVKA